LSTGRAKPARHLAAIALARPPSASPQANAGRAQARRTGWNLCYPGDNQP